MKYDCPECGEQIKRRRAARVLDRLNLGRKGRPVLYTVLTVPMEARARFQDRKVWRATLRKVWAVLRERFGAEFGVESSHPFGSPEEDDFSPEIFHPHANFLWVQKRGFSPFLDVDALRAVWCEILGVPVSVVWHHYFRGPEDIIVRVRYVMRTFPGFASWVGSIRWYGQYPKKLPEHVWKCDVCGEPFLFMRVATKEEHIAYVCRARSRDGPIVSDGTLGELLIGDAGHSIVPGSSVPTESTRGNI